MTEKRRKVADRLGQLAPGYEVFGLTEGEFDLIDIVEHCLAQTGPAYMDVMIWTYYSGHLDRVEQLIRSGQILRSRWLVDRFNWARGDIKRKQLQRLVDMAGAANVRSTQVHAKIITLSNEQWSLVIRTSGNLNKNLRSENYEISDDPNMLRLVTAMMDHAMIHPLTDLDSIKGDDSRLVAVESSQTLLGAIQYPRKAPTSERSKMIRYTS